MPDPFRNLSSPTWLIGGVIILEAEMQKIFQYVLIIVFLISPCIVYSELPPAPEEAFSIVVIPDTQKYLGKGTKAQPESTEEVTNPVFAAYTQWIVDNLEKQRVVFVSHVGDIVDRNMPEQWVVARHQMDRLHGRIPYGISVGNHDSKSNGDSSLFQEYFPVSRFQDFVWYGGCYQNPDGDPSISGNNANSYQLFSAGGMDFIFFHLECNAPDDVLAWADGLLKRYADRKALITTHMYLGPLNKPKESQGYYDDPKGRMQWTKRHGDRGNSAQQMWDKCFRKNANLLAIFCGDQSRTQSMYRAIQGDHGNLVHELLSDYGSEGLRVYRFFPQACRIEVMTYNPIAEKLCGGTRIVPEEGRHQFVVQAHLAGTTCIH
ncbi:MAG: metallophosphoesterase [Candidatus Latescibacteria bacterium]|nr:metallophosphoesterase [Candidatus Latescibacterota bacterium]